MGWTLFVNRCDLQKERGTGMRALEKEKKEDEGGHSHWFGDSELWIKVPEALRRSWCRRRTLGGGRFTERRTEGDFLHNSLGELRGH